MNLSTEPLSMPQVVLGQCLVSAYNYGLYYNFCPSLLVIMVYIIEVLVKVLILWFHKDTVTMVVRWIGGIAIHHYKTSRPYFALCTVVYQSQIITQFRAVRKLMT